MTRRGIRLWTAAWAAIGGVAVVVVGALLVLIFLMMRSFSDPYPEAHRFIYECVDEVLVSRGVNRVDLDVLAGHTVERVCTYYGTAGFVSVPLARAVADFGLTMDIDADAKIPERHFAIFLIGPDGEVTYGALSSRIFDLRGPCRTGTHLALQFDTLDPLAGGRIVDLDAPDLRPTMIE